VSPELGIGVDLGATRIRVCVGDKDGKVLWKSSREMPLPKEVDAYVDEVVGTVRLATEHIKRPARLKGVGVASAGPLDLKRGCLARPANLPYKSVPIVAPLEERFGTRVTLLNDADAAALGERRFGAGKDHENLVYITLSTGIGGGAIVDGHLLIGKDGNAGEIGHLVVDSAGRLECGCGGRGHWEACCSGRGIPKLAELVAAERGGTGGGKSVGELLGESGPIDSATILKSASKGNQFGIRVAEEVGRLNALGVANTVNMFDPSLVTIGGAVALNNRELILGPIRERVPLNAVNRVPKIIITPLGDDVGLLGALTLVFGDGTLR
jgi:glucokinase